MTFKAHLGKVNLILVFALLAALLLPVLSVAAGQAIAFNENLDTGSAENAHPDGTSAVEIVCGCGDPGGGSGCC